MFLKNETVYLEGTLDDKIYVVYTGMFKLQKLPKGVDKANLMVNNFECGVTVLRLIKEDLTGLEACNGEPYRFTLQVYTFIK
jgi:CRP-like cAMP-binding protein